MTDFTALRKLLLYTFFKLLKMTEFDHFYGG